MKIAILADLHLSDNFNTVKSPVLDWALAEVKKQNCDSICCIGDLTAQGSREQTAEVLRRLAGAQLPVCSTPGNAELRIYRDGETAKMFDIAPVENVPVVLIDTSWDEPEKSELQKLENLPDNGGFLLATHNPVPHWSEQAQAAVKKAQQRKAVTAIIAGHSHHDEANILRGLDPDKASGGPPMLAVMERNADGSWLRTDCVMPGVDPGDWNSSEREIFWRNIGFSTMWEEVEAFEFAIKEGVQNVELRPGFKDIDNLPANVEKWRQAGGRVLSLHLPDLKLNDQSDSLRSLSELAVQLRCDRVTLHVPRVTAAEFAGKKTLLLDKFAADLQPLLENNVVIGIENLHTSTGENTFETRNFGCTIAECREWIMLLREKFSTDSIGFHIDIGHCRNNAPISGRENLSDWYLQMGDLINGWHIHQVGYDNGKFSNHQPLNGFYEKLISLGGLFMAYRTGQFKEVPMFLEARSFAGNIQAYKNLQQLFVR